MKNRKIKKNSGFVALMSAVIISVVLLLIATNLSLTSFYGRANILDFELKEKSYALVEACVDTALLRLANDPTYPHPVNDPINVDGNECIIENVMGAGPKIINVMANYKNYITKLKVEVGLSDFSIDRWEEI